MGNAWSRPEIFNPNKLWTPQQLLPYFVGGLYIVILVWKSCCTFIIFAVGLAILYYLILFILIHLFLFQRDKRDGFPKRLDVQLRKLENDHHKKMALVHELGALPNAVAPGQLFYFLSFYCYRFYYADVFPEIMLQKYSGFILLIR